MKTAAALFLVLVTVLAGCGKKDSRKDDGKGGVDETGADLATAKPDVTMKAEDWHAEFAKDKKAAEAKYTGKVIELTGRVSTVLQNLDAGVAFIHLKVEKDFMGVRCGTKDINIWEKVPQGADITIRGRLPDGGFFAGELMPVHVVSVDKNPTTSMTATQLAVEFTKNKEKLKEKWDDKWIYVEGEFVRTGKSQHGTEQIVLKGEGMVDIKCSIPADAKAQAGKLKPGQKVKVLGQLSVYDEPSLEMAMFRGL